MSAIDNFSSGYVSRMYGTASRYCCWSSELMASHACRLASVTKSGYSFSLTMPIWSMHGLTAGRDSTPSQANSEVSEPCGRVLVAVSRPFQASGVPGTGRVPLAIQSRWTEEHVSLSGEGPARLIHYLYPPADRVRVPAGLMRDPTARHKHG